MRYEKFSFKTGKNGRNFLLSNVRNNLSGILNLSNILPKYSSKCLLKFELINPH